MTPNKPALRRCRKFAFFCSLFNFIAARPRKILPLATHNKGGRAIFFATNKGMMIRAGIRSIKSAGGESNRFHFAVGNLIRQRHISPTARMSGGGGATTVFELPGGRVISCFVEVLPGRFFIAAANELFYIDSATQVSSCIRLQDRILDVHASPFHSDAAAGAATVLCLGCMGTVTEVLLEEQQQQHFALRSRQLASAAAATSGLSTSGFLFSCEGGKRVWSVIGTYFGEVVVTEVSRHLDGTSKVSASYSSSSSAKVKCHETGIVSCMSSALLICGQQQQQQTILFATGSDERRACFVKMTLSDSTSPASWSSTALRLPFEPGRVRSIHISAENSCSSADTTTTMMMMQLGVRCFTSCEDGSLRLYRICEQRQQSEQLTASLLAIVQNAHDGGLNGGALSMADVKRPPRVVGEAAAADVLVTGGADGKICFWTASTLSTVLPSQEQETVSSSSNYTPFSLSSSQQLRSLCVFSPTRFAAVSSDWEVVISEQQQRPGRQGTQDSSESSSVAINELCRFKLREKNAAETSADGCIAAHPTCIGVTLIDSSSGSPSFVVAIGDTAGNARVVCVRQEQQQQKQSEQRSQTAVSIIFAPVSLALKKTRAAISEIKVVVLPSRTVFSVTCSAASGSVMEGRFNLSVDSNPPSSFLLPTKQSDAEWSDACLGRTIITVAQRSVQGSAALLRYACDRRGVHELSCSSSSTIERININDDGDNEPLTRGGGSNRLLSSAADAFSGPRKLDMWCPTALLLLQNGATNDWQLEVIHKNRFFQRLQLPSGNSTAPRPLCPDLPVRDVLAASRNFAVLHASAITLWHRGRNRAVASSSAHFNAARLRSAEIFEDANSAAVVWSNDSMTITFVVFRMSHDDEQQQEREHECGSHDINCCAAVSSDLIVTGSDEDVSLWRVGGKSGPTTLIVSRLAFHTASVLATSVLSQLNLVVTVGSAASLAFWKVSAGKEVDALLQYSEQPTSGTASTQELERFLCCDAFLLESSSALSSSTAVIGVGSSCSDVVIFSFAASSLSQENTLSNSNTKAALQDHNAFRSNLRRRRVAIHPPSSDDDDGNSNQKMVKRPVFCVAITAANDDDDDDSESILLFCGTGHGAVLLITQISLRDDPSEGATDEISFPTTQTREQQEKHARGCGGAITCLNIFTATTGAAQSEGKYLAAAQEGGSAALWKFSAAASSSNKRPGASIQPLRLFNFFHAACHTTPRAVFAVAARSDKITLVVVEEGRRVVLIETSSNNGSLSAVREQFVSVSRLRGGCRASDASSVIVAGQGLQLL